MAKRGRRAKTQRGAPAAQAPARPAADVSTDIAVQTAAPGTADASVPAGSASTAPAGGSRALANALIAAFLLFQIAMPLRYYLGGRGYDERFSWRMFSSVRMQRCDVRVNDVTSDGSERKVNLERELQVAWIGMLERYRAQVVDELLQRRCSTGDVREARYERTCKDTDGSQLPRLQVTLDCRNKKVQRREGDS